MNRKEFLFELWKKIMQPGVIILVLFITIKFFYFAITTNGTERQTIIILSGFVLFITFLLLLRLLLSVTMGWFKNLVPQGVSKNILALSNKLNYLSPVAFGVLLYITWAQQGYIAFLVIAFYFVMDLREIILEKVF